MDQRTECCTDALLSRVKAGIKVVAITLQKGYDGLSSGTAI